MDSLQAQLIWKARRQHEILEGRGKRDFKMGMKMPLCEVEGTRNIETLLTAAFPRAYTDPTVYSIYSNLSDGGIQRSN